jgi:hypothetical protein
VTDDRVRQLIDIAAQECIEVLTARQRLAAACVQRDAAVAAVHRDGGVPIRDVAPVVRKALQDYEWLTPADLMVMGISEGNVRLMLARVPREG